MMMIKRRFEEKCIIVLCSTAAVSALMALFYILITIFLSALPSLNLMFILTPESAAEHAGGGIFHAIVGSFVLSIWSTIIATPLAIGTAVYLQKYTRKSKWTKLVRFYIEVLSGTPSIVLGMFGFLVFVYYMKQVTGGYSLISGSIALAILIMPVIERAAEHAIEAVPTDIEHGSFALGADKWQTIRMITIPASLSGILTGLILGFGRAAEESAVVLLTAGYTQFLPEFAIKNSDKLAFGIKIYPFQDLIGTLPITVYNAYESSRVIPLSHGMAAAFVLLILVLCVNLCAKGVLWYGSRGSHRQSPLFLSLRRVIFRDSPAPAGIPACSEIDTTQHQAERRRIQLFFSLEGEKKNTTQCEMPGYRADRQKGSDPNQYPAPDPGIPTPHSSRQDHQGTSGLVQSSVKSGVPPARLAALSQPVAAYIPHPPPPETASPLANPDTRNSSPVSEPVPPGQSTPEQAAALWFKDSAWSLDPRYPDLDDLFEDPAAATGPFPSCLMISGDPRAGREDLADRDTAGIAYRAEGIHEGAIRLPVPDDPGTVPPGPSAAGPPAGTGPEPGLPGRSGQSGQTVRTGRFTPVPVVHPRRVIARRPPGRIPGGDPFRPGGAWRDDHEEE